MIASFAHARDEGVVQDEAICGPKQSFTTQKIKVQDGEGMWRALSRAGLGREDISAALKAFSKLGSIDFVPPGREFGIKSDEQGRLMSVEQRTTAAMVQCVEREAEAKFAVRTFELPIETRVELVSGRVKRTLNSALEAIGEKPALAYLLREIFTQRGKDLVSDARGLAFRAVVEKRIAGDELVGYGQILAAEIILANGKRHRAFYYEPKNGEAGHYNESGTLWAPPAMRMPILAATITSGYGVRNHPLNGKPQAHLGIDFAGIEGTEVHAAREGVVELSQGESDLGNFVSIQHEGALITRYGHLSAFAPGLHDGQWVKKGALIGYVGSTGLATGPHLHFETIAGGMHLNPARYFSKRVVIKDAPKLEDDELARFYIATAQLAALFSDVERGPFASAE